MRNIIFVFLLLFLANCEPASKPAESVAVNSTSASSLEQKLNEDPFLVDVRTPEEFAEGSVKGAINIPLDKVQERISEFKNKKNIVTFCRSGKRSSKAIAILNENGITDVTNGTDQETIEKAQQSK